MRNIVLVVFPHFVFILPQHDVIALNMIFSYPTLLRHSVEYYVKTPYLVSYCVYMTISQLAVSQSETMNLLNKLYYLLSISDYFSKRGSQVCCQLARLRFQIRKLGGNFATKFASSF